MVDGRWDGSGRSADPSTIYDLRSALKCRLFSTKQGYNISLISAILQSQALPSSKFFVLFRDLSYPDPVTFDNATTNPRRRHHDGSTRISRTVGFSGGVKRNQTARPHFGRRRSRAAERRRFHSRDRSVPNLSTIRDPGWLTNRRRRRTTRPAATCVAFGLKRRGGIG